MTNNEIVAEFDDDKDDSLKISLKPLETVTSCLILYLTGYIDTYNSGSFQKQVTKAIEAGFVKLIFNCNGLNYVSSTGIGSFTSFLKTVRSKSGDIVLMEIQPKVYEVFQLLGFSQFFNIKSSIDEAVEFFDKAANQQETSGTFPKIFKCPICSKKLKAVKAGRFRCSECKTIIAIEGNGKVFLG